ncbi:hypothetical protein [Veillonella caviae]|uniref:hypothetical protein n=1 Tax=Veillonella caviae TaxID=248316 RepID=UPI002A90F4F4|nr:hypothetical protein [Veillonella caviae]MDY6224643.1 hypothetical protein [Veillonella caviae]
MMNKEEFWEFVNGGGRVYTYDDRIDFYCAFTEKGYDAGLVATEETSIYKDYDDLLNRFMIDGKPLIDCLDKIDC